MSASFNLTRTKATGANSNCLVSAVNNRLNLSDVRLPASVGLSVGVGNIATEGYALSANFTLSHSKHLPNKYRGNAVREWRLPTMTNFSSHNMTIIPQPF